MTHEAQVQASKQDCSMFTVAPQLHMYVLHDERTTNQKEKGEKNNSITSPSFSSPSQEAEKVKKVKNKKETGPEMVGLDGFFFFYGLQSWIDSFTIDDIHTEYRVQSTEYGLHALGTCTYLVVGTYSVVISIHPSDPPSPWLVECRQQANSRIQKFKKSSPQPQVPSGPS